MTGQHAETANTCRTIGCNDTAPLDWDFCNTCTDKHGVCESSTNKPLSEKYPKYYKPLGDLTEIDVYATHHLFNIQDPSGCIQHASKKLLLSGARTGGKSMQKDIAEARDTLTRWLQLNQD